LGASLAAMVANLSAHKKGWDARWEFFSDWAVKAQVLQQQLCSLVDADTQAFNSIITAMQLPKISNEEQQLRKAAIEHATLEAIRVPYRVMQLSFAAFEPIAAMAAEGNPNSASDAGVAALAARAAIRGAWLNVKINAQGYAQHPEVMQILDAAATIVDNSQNIETEVLQRVESHIKL
jgi:glutamate formiminotransferase/formiminotetrahydrofolate cyclodeaminase